MAVSFRILPDRGLVYIRYDGSLNATEGMVAFRDYMAHPDCRPGQKHLVDLSRVTTVERDYAVILQLQATKADHFLGPATETLIVYFAPTPVPRQAAGIILRSWDGVDHVIARVLDDEAQALAVLGQPERRIADLIAETGTA